MDEKTLTRLRRGERVVIRVEDLDEEDIALIMPSRHPDEIGERVVLRMDWKDFTERAARADADRAFDILDEIPDVPPDPGDEI